MIPFGSARAGSNKDHDYYPDHLFRTKRPGTSGLRKKTKQFEQPRYVENIVQSVMDVLREDVAKDLSEKTLVIGGDGRVTTTAYRDSKDCAARGGERIRHHHGGLRRCVIDTRDVGGDPQAVRAGRI